MRLDYCIKVLLNLHIFPLLNINCTEACLGPLHRGYIIVQFLKCKIPEKVLLTEATGKRFSFFGLERYVSFASRQIELLPSPQGTFFITSHSPKFQICRLGSHRNFACVKTPLFKPFQKWPNMVNFTTENKTYCFRVWSAFLDTNGDVLSSTHSICNYNLVPWWRRQRKQIMNSRSFNRDYYSFKIFPRFGLAKRTRLIHHNQLLLTKLRRILCLARKRRQKCSVLAG